MYWYVFDRLDALNRPWPFIFIGWWGLSRKKSFYRSKSMKILNYTRTPCGPVRPTDQTSRSCQISYRNFGRSDCLWTPVRPVTSSCCQFWLSTYALLFFGKACVPKNTLLDQNCLRSITIYRPYLASSSSWWWNNLLGLPYLLHGRRPCWYNLCLLFHGLFLTHPLQPPLLGVR